MGQTKPRAQCAGASAVIPGESWDTPIENNQSKKQELGKLSINDKQEKNLVIKWEAFLI